MAITDYTSLQSAILNWINRPNDADAILRCPEWIQLAEDEIKSELSKSPLRQCEVNDTAFIITNEYTALPDGLLRVRDIAIQGERAVALKYITPESVNRLGNLTSQVAKPEMYTIQGNQLRVIPTPDSSYTATFNYQALTSLSASNQTNNLLTNHPKIYLFAALTEAARYYRDLDGANVADSSWRNLFASAYAADGQSAAAGSLQMRTDNGNP